MRAKILLGLAVLTAGLVSADAALAQVRFSIGSGGVSVGNYPPGYPYGPGYGYGPRYYAPPPVVVNRYYTAPAVQYVQPRATAAYSGPGVTIRNPQDPDVQINYTIDGQREFEIAPGESQHLPEKGKYLIVFDRGGRFGLARYTIHEGVYEFTPTDHGWELYRQKDVTPTANREPQPKANPLPQPTEKKAAASELTGQET